MEITPALGKVTQVQLNISTHYLWDMGVLLGDVHISEQERLDKLCATVRIEPTTIRSSFNNSNHSANSSPNIHTSKLIKFKFSFN